jgi:pilus assembly protein CpaB
MKIKWTAAVLTLLGTAAAACAVVMMASLRAGTAKAAEPGTAADVEILVAGKDMPPMTVIDGSSVTVRTLPSDQVPPEFMSNPVLVVGKMLKLRMVEGQPFTKECFLTEGFPIPPEGKRAMSVELTSWAGLEGVLYPGSVVDVLAAFKPPNGDKQEAMSTTLLRRIQVLGIEGETIISEEPDDVDKTHARGFKKRRTVTLLVDAKQAQILQLALEFGTVSLTLRNPLDSTVDDGEKITSLREFFGSNPEFLWLEQERAPAPQEASNPAPTTRPAAQWNVVVIEGTSIRTVPVPLKTQD